MRGAILTIAACLLLALAGCGGGGDSSATTESTAQSADSSEAGSLSEKPKVTVPKGAPPKQLVTKDLIEGEGAEAKAGDEATVQYVGVNYRTGKEFDSSWDRGEPFTFTLGAQEVIAAWEQGVEGMKVGGRRELILPPRLGYGAAGSPPAVPPNETLIFVVDLVSLK